MGLIVSHRQEKLTVAHKKDKKITVSREKNQKHLA